MKFEWENISCTTYRAKVFGGWLVSDQVTMKSDDSSADCIANTLVFIPDPNHQWEIEN